MAARFETDVASLVESKAVKELRDELAEARALLAVAKKNSDRHSQLTKEQAQIQHALTARRTPQGQIVAFNRKLKALERNRQAPIRNQ